MAKVVVTRVLKEEIFKKFKGDSENILLQLYALKNNPRKGKTLSSIEGIVIKEIKYTTFRFYCITDGYTLKFGSQEELAALLIKFVKMSEKKNQQKAIDEIKNVLVAMGFEGF